MATMDIQDRLAARSFSEAWGDGVYPSLWGLDSEDRLVSLVTDFLLFDDDT